MKRIIFTLLGLLMMTNASALEYQYDPLVREGKVWVECQLKPTNKVDYLTYYQFKGTTTINGVEYKNLYATKNTKNITDEDIPIAFMYEANKKVYAILNGLAYGEDYQWGVDGNFVHIYGCQLVNITIGKYIMYDFNNYFNPYTTHFDYYSMNNSLTTNQMQIGDLLANYFSFISFYYAPPGSMYCSIAEGIGPLYKAFINIWNDDRLYLGLAWVEDGDEIIYRGRLYNEAVDFLNYTPLVREGVKWVEYYKNTIEDTQHVTYYQFSGEEHIGDHDYSKLYATVNIDTISEDDTPVAYVREENKQVFIIPSEVEVNGCKLTDASINEYQIYDFNDITAPYVVDDYLINPVDSELVSIDGNLINLYTLGGSKKIAEGIGCLDNVFFNPWHIELPDGSQTSLAWVEDNGEIIYKNDCYEDAEAASGYVKIVREGVVWEYVAYTKNYFQPEELEDLSIYTLEFKGTDSLTNEDGTTTLYHKLYRTDYDEHGNIQEEKLVAHVKEEAKMVNAKTYDYWWAEIDIDTLYNFSKPLFLPNLAYEFSLSNIISSKPFEINVGGTVRKGRYVKYVDPWAGGVEELRVIEGIGIDCTYGDLIVPYRNYNMGYEISLAGLASVYENGDLIYKGCMHDVAQELKRKKEDVNGDGYVTAADVTALYNYLLGDTNEASNSYDVDGDGEVTSADITAVYNILLGNRN